MPSTKSYDLIIIGAGAAGIAAAETAAIHKKRIALIEGDKIGGESLWTGCIPSKTLINAAHRAYKHGKIDTEAAYMEAKKSIDRATAIIQKTHDNKKYFEGLGIDVFTGAAHFINPHTIAVAGKKIEGRHFLLATGSDPFIPDIPGIGGVKYFTNENIFSLKKVPKSLIVLGGGPNGCELAQAFNRLGVKTTLLQRNQRLLPRDDEEVSDFILSTLKREGVSVELSAQVSKIESKKGTVVVVYEARGQSLEIEAEGLLAVVGRRPHTQGLELEKIGVKVTERGVWCNGRLETSLPHIYVAGDVAGEYGFTHFAASQGTYVARAIFEKETGDFSSRVVPWVTFCDPELAHVGITEGELKKDGKKYKKIIYPYTRIDRAITEDKTQGFIKLLIGEDDKVLGCQIAGARAGEVIHEVVMAMEFDITASELGRVIHAYPTYSSGIGDALIAPQSKSEDVRLDSVMSRLRDKI